jgi:hypothetical protein
MNPEVAFGHVVHTCLKGFDALPPLSAGANGFIGAQKISVSNVALVC